jgi:hypothetical protein
LNADAIRTLKEESKKRSKKENPVNNGLQINLSNDFGEFGKY